MEVFVSIVVEAVEEGSHRCSWASVATAEGRSGHSLEEQSQATIGEEEMLEMLEVLFVDVSKTDRRRVFRDIRGK